MKPTLLLIGLLVYVCFGLGHALPLEWPGLQGQLPERWQFEPRTSSEDSHLLGVLVTPHRALVFVRRYPPPNANLADLGRELRYAIVVKQEGKVIHERSTQLNGNPMLEIHYLGRSNQGPMKKFTRWVLQTPTATWAFQAVCPDPQQNLLEVRGFLQTLQSTVSAEES